MMALRGVKRNAYKLCASLLRDSRMLDYTVKGRTVRNLLSTFSWRVMGSEIPNPMIVWGHKIHHWLEPGSAVPMATESFEPETTRCLLGLLKPGQVFVDIGAHIGYYTLLGARAVGPEGHVYAFEPAPANLPLLTRNIRANGYEDRVTVIPKAVLNSPGRVQLFLDPEDTGSNSLFTVSPTSEESVNVEATTLGEFFGRAGWPAVHLMKMDIEGSEKAALEGMRELSIRNPRLRLIMEFFPRNLDAADVTPELLFGVLRELGFTRISVIAKNLVPVKTPEDVLHAAPKVRQFYVNLLCEKAPVR
jgi:FkbM family methyltransferase